MSRKFLGSVFIRREFEAVDLQLLLGSSLYLQISSNISKGSSLNLQISPKDPGYISKYLQKSSKDENVTVTEWASSIQGDSD